MKYSVLLLLVLPILSYAQTDTTTFQNSNSFSCTLYVDIPPEFPGGPEALVNYLSKIKCSADTLKHEKPRRTYVGFVVTETGKVNNVRIFKSADSNCDQEIIQLIREMPDWKPGKLLEKNVPVEMQLPIKLD